MLRNSPKFSFHRPQMHQVWSALLDLIMGRIPSTGCSYLQFKNTKGMTYFVLKILPPNKKYSDFCYSFVWLFRKQNNKHNSYIFRVITQIWNRKIKKRTLSRPGHWSAERNTIEMSSIGQFGNPGEVAKDCQLGQKL